MNISLSGEPGNPTGLQAVEQNLKRSCIDRFHTGDSQTICTFLALCGVAGVCGRTLGKRVQQLAGSDKGSGMSRRAVQSGMVGYFWRLVGTVLLLAAQVSLLQAKDGGTSVRHHNLGQLGRVTTPTSWQRSQESDGAIRIQSADGYSGVRLYPVTGVTPPKATGWLKARARELEIPDFVRSVDSALKEQSGVRHGIFVLGTVPLDTLPAELEEYDVAGNEPPPPEGLEAPEPRPSEYRMVVVYADERSVYALEGWSASLPGGANVLSEVHRSWRFPSKR